MGTWGTGLYQNDNAADLKAEFKLYAGLELSPDALLRTLAERAGVLLEEPCEDADASAFWLAMADQYHAHGLEHPMVFERAIGLIDDGTDITLQTELGLSPADQTRRARVLAELREKWAHPPRKIRKIKRLKPEPFLMQIGEVLTYPTMATDARYKPLGTIDIANYAFKPDAVNAFVVLGTHRVFHGTFARYFIAPLVMFYEHSLPTLETCQESFFLCECNFPLRSFRSVSAWCEISKRDLALIEAKSIGCLDLSADRVGALFPDVLTPPESPYQGRLGILANTRCVFDETARGVYWGSHEDTLGSLVART